MWWGLLNFVGQAFAHGAEDEHAAEAVEGIIDTVEIATPSLETLVNSYSIWAVYAAAASIGLLIFFAILIRYPSESVKRVLFWSITGIIAITTGLLAGMTIYVNQSSVTKGPVHWHADFEIWACGVRQNLQDPEGVSNRIGSPSFHEHNEERLHVEGVVMDSSDVDLGAFFRVIGGSISNSSLTIPTNEGKKTFISGQKCNSSNDAAELQVFVYEADMVDKTYSQRKIINPQDFQYVRESQVPPGNCIIIEFNQEKEITDKICQTYQDAITTGKLTKEITHQEEDGH